MKQSPSEEGKKTEHDCTKYAKINCKCLEGDCIYENRLFNQLPRWSDQYVRKLQFEIQKLESKLKELENRNPDLAKAWSEGVSVGASHDPECIPNNPYGDVDKSNQEKK